MQQGARRQKVIDRVQLDIEPSHIALGPGHLAVALNNKVWFYALQGNDIAASTDEVEYKSEEPRIVHEQEYGASVEKLLMNNRFAAVQCGQKVFLQSVEPRTGFETYTVPERDRGGEVVQDFCLTCHHLIYATTDGSVEYFALDDMAHLPQSILTHDLPIQAIHSNASGTLSVVIDSAGNGMVVSPLPSQAPLPLPGLS